MGKRKRAKSPAKPAVQQSQPSKPVSPAEAVSSVLHPPQTTGQITIQQYQGPIPDPETLRKYDQIVPGAAERIIHMAEQEGEHRRRMEQLALEAEKTERKTGQMLGFAIAVGCLVAFSWAVYLGAYWPAAVIAAGGMGMLVTAFVVGRSERSSSS